MTRQPIENRKGDIEVTRATATRTLSIVGGRPHIDGRPLEPSDRVELTAWELARLIHECIGEFRWNIRWADVRWGCNVDLGERAPARILAGPFDRELAAIFDAPDDAA
jgi:hypothetical protein